MSSHCNSYGWSGGFAALCAAVSMFLAQEKSCRLTIGKLFTDTFNQHHLEVFHYVAIIVGVILFVLSFFDFAGLLSEISLVFIACAIGIFSVGAMMLYAAYADFYMACDSIVGQFTQANVFDGKDGYGITIMMLDIISALLLISAAISFSRTY